MKNILQSMRMKCITLGYKIQLSQISLQGLFSKNKNPLIIIHAGPQNCRKWGHKTLAGIRTLKTTSRNNNKTSNLINFLLLRMKHHWWTEMCTLRKTNEPGKVSNEYDE